METIAVIGVAAAVAVYFALVYTVVRARCKQNSDTRHEGDVDNDVDARILELERLIAAYRERNGL